MRSRAGQPARKGFPSRLYHCCDCANRMRLAASSNPANAARLPGGARSNLVDSVWWREWVPSPGLPRRWTPGGKRRFPLPGRGECVRSLLPSKLHTYCSMDTIVIASCRVHKVDDGRLCISSQLRRAGLAANITILHESCVAYVMPTR